MYEIEDITEGNTRTLHISAAGKSKQQCNLHFCFSLCIM